MPGERDPERGVGTGVDDPDPDPLTGFGGEGGRRCRDARLGQRRLGEVVLLRISFAAQSFGFEALLVSPDTPSLSYLTAEDAVCVAL